VVADELKIFKKLEHINWAWTYLKKHEDGVMEKKQFDCIVCMILEAKFQQYKIDGVQQNIKIKMGEVFFDRKVVISKKGEEFSI